MNTLAIDTSGKTLGIAVLKDSQILCEIFLNTGLNHSLILLPEIDKALNSVNIALADIDLFVATSGPGSFTGLRIGLSTLKGLALSWQKPLVGVSTLEALAHNICDDQRLICPILKGPMAEIYAGVYRYQYPAYYCVLEDRVTEINQLSQEIKEPVIFIGEGAMYWHEAIQKALEKRAHFAPDACSICRASSVAAIGIDKYRNNDVQNAVTLIPSYLRVSEAELKRGKD
ncbi:MAG: tRNA (adenosine(37)-N6)-threonylcarbamoyltransferase complex dimerization subunit type 1 TsaB [Syntrophaceae bacterium]|nr:tRNA (adenosine(37)-N6)-threonylcarbamoyltransferase complex dimerization subunit type 1 TsaB [Syntrophaceae bacterium]